MPLLEINMPADWAEIIRAGKFDEVIKLLTTPFPTEAHARFRMFQLLSGLSDKKLGKLLGAGNAALEISMDDSVEIVEVVFPLMDFIFQNQQFFINPYQQFTHGGFTWACCKSGRLSDQTGEEWAVSHQQLFEFSKDNDKTHLPVFLAANYHRVTDGKRTELNMETITDDANLLNDLPEHMITGILLWYNHADKWWADTFPWLFNPEADGEKREADGKEIRSILFELSGNKIDASWDTVRKRSRQDIVFALDELEKKREAAEEAAEDNS